MLLVYNRRNLAGSGCHDPEDEGLTDLGRAILAEMDRVGMVKCCSHTGYRTAREILDSTDRPVIFSHSNPRALRDHPRNIPDDLIRACAATGGVVGINGVGLFLGTGPPTAEVIVRNIDYVAQLVGRRARGARARLHVQELGARRARARRPGDLAAANGATDGAPASRRPRSSPRSARASRASDIPPPPSAASSARTCCASPTPSGAEPGGPPGVSGYGECAPGHPPGPVS